ncbi:hypothetical protein M407DRAFT_234005 [Tulasnella calospora MUT 4182]|uniref:RRM domain-containing protein n=1 Tax=Tulasnella calospora MUT 4182 TaxID=1051891 RepID=A0A0C3KZV7_9AGAM|nr:hypothetical protein M407DRAFT_234005 [Tulasnella calospora MUT 4182]
MSLEIVAKSRAALQLKNESWEIQSLMRASEEVVNGFNKCIAQNGWQSRSHDPEFGNNRPISPEDRVVDLSTDERYVGDNGWSTRRRPGENPMDYERPGSGQSSLQSQVYRGPPDPSFTDAARGRGDIPPRDSLDGPRSRSGRSPTSSDFRRPLSPPPGRQGPGDSARYGNAPVAPGPRRGVAVDYPPSSYTSSDRSIAPRDARGQYPEDRYRREVSPPPQWSDSRRRPYEDSALELEASNKRMRLNDGGDPARSRPRDYPPVDPAASYRGSPVDPSYRQPPPRGPPDGYPPPPPAQYRSRTMDDQFPASSARFGRDEPQRYRSSDDYDTQYRRAAVGPPYSTSLDSGPNYRGSIAPPYAGYSSPDSISSRNKPLPPVSRTPGPPVDYPATYRVDDRRSLADYRQPEEYSRRFVEPAPPSRMPRQEDPRRGYLDGYPPPVVDDRRYESRRYDARLSDAMMDREYDRRGPSQYPAAALPPAARPPSPPRLSLASRLGMDTRGPAMDAPSGPRYRGNNDYDPLMTDAPSGPSYRDDYRRLEDPRDRDRERFDDQRATAQAGFDLRDKLTYDSRDRERGRDAAERERDRPRDRERDRDYPDDRYRRDSTSSQTRPFDRPTGTRVGGIHPADGTVIFVSNLPAQVSQPRFRRMFADAVGSDNVMDVNTGRAGFAFVRIRTRELAEEAVSKLHHVEFAPKYKMNVSIGKPPHEYRKWKNGGYHSSKRSIDNRPGPPGAGHAPDAPTQPKQNANKKKKKNRKNNAGPTPVGVDKEKSDDRGEVEGPDAEDSGDESSPGSDADGTDIRHGEPGGAQMTQEEIEAFMENAARAGFGDHSKDDESTTGHSGGANENEERRPYDTPYSDSQTRPNAFEHRADSAGEGYRHNSGVEPHPDQRLYDSHSAPFDSRDATDGSTRHSAKEFRASGLGRNEFADADPDDAAVAEQLADLEARSAPSEA